ncbi:acetyl-CoA carboxylase biotin carboxyl carrier protein subunit [Enterococcus florum]|uniref:Acetyl-CoA carboxylase biotin carboxyl carrier protein subunit n=1 Tax=Enterococcus florum TaxID=2480627 RepID=A0A4P5PC98_9ENTE|nr:DUF2118 domain-containing protein [Enterococcus florum]GCF95710.1 acetyl-CoA carboxylase biotin carboxyl carrier protein subunit [Enterococcus florum]
MKNYEVTVNGQVYQVSLRELSEDEPIKQVQKPQNVPEPSSEKLSVSAPMAGTILSIKVKIGDRVKSGDTLCILEAMKMETPVLAPQDGTVSAIEVSENQSVESSQRLMTI